MGDEITAGLAVLTGVGVTPYILGAATVGIAFVLWRSFKRG